MMALWTNQSLARRLGLAALLLTFAAAGAPRAMAQSAGNADDPTVHSPLPEPPDNRPEPTQGMKVAQAICWYLPNRVMDFTDIFRFHLAVDDGLGATLRVTRYLYASWFHDNAYCLGWTKRTPPFFSEQIEERYFALGAANEGEFDRDPTEVGLSLHILLIGANLAVSTGEAIDGLAGIVGVDLMGDDHGPMMVDYVPEEEAPELVPAMNGNPATPAAAPGSAAPVADPAPAAEPAPAADEAAPAAEAPTLEPERVK